VRFLKALFLNVLVIGTILFLLAWGAAIALNSFTRHGESLTLPNLKGLKIDAAASVLQQKKLRYIITDTVFMENVPKLAVVEQNPAPNSKVKEGRIIYLSINSDAQATIQMPNLMNSSLTYAQTVLNSFGLKLGTVTYKPDIAQNAVLDQLWNGRSVQPTMKVPKGATIDLIVGDGSGGTLVDIPNLTGLTLRDATQVLNSSLLVLGSVIYDGPVKDSTKAVVTNQSPAYTEGATIKSGEIIDIYLSIP
jgi:beta-lactam-binding protein with PASTA domain